MKKIICLLLILGTTSVSAQKIRELYANSIKCYKLKKYECFLSFSHQLDSIRPSHPTYTYNLACAYALNGMPDKAFPVLEKAILMDGNLEFEKEEDLSSLRTLPDYERLLKLKADLAKETATSVKVTTLSEKDLHPEGLVYLPKAKKWLTGSVRKGKIVSFDIKSGKCKDWLNVEGTFSVMAMKPDADERFLWVATAATEQWSGFKKELDGKSEILKVDIRSKKIVQRFAILGKHVFGDLLVAKNGTVYISDSFGPSLFRIDSDAITHWIDFDGPTYNFQGMTFNDDESKMYVADYFSGIMEIPMDDIKNRKWMIFPNGSVVKGIDGLSWYDNSLIAIQNGIKPIRIVRYFLNGSGTMKDFKIIDNSRAEFNEPTLGFVKDKTLFFFANSPWSAYDKTNNLDESKYSNPMLYSYKLD